MNLERPIFDGVCAASPRRPFLAGSVVFHCLVLAWLLHSPAAIFVSPNSIQHGENGTAVTEIYWTQQMSAEEQRTLEKEQLVWKAPAKNKHQKVKEEPVPDTGPVDTAISASKVDSATPSVGSPYGSLTYGSISGLEVRPAIRIRGSEPHLDPDELEGTPEGNEIIELTIDAGGEIVEKTVIQSLGPVVDAKVLAAVADWRFRPATKDGVAIPSKQDVYYHYPPRH